MENTPVDLVGVNKANVHEFKCLFYQNFLIRCATLKNGMEPLIRLLVYEIKRDLALIRQGNLSVVDYSSKIRNLWYLLDQLRPPIEAPAGTKTMIEEREAEDRSMQFLMGLNDVYQSERNHILFLDKLPPVNKIYAMIARAEKHREVTVNMGISADDSAMMVRNRVQRADHDTNAVPVINTGQVRGDKAVMFCNYCKRNGHLKENCFRLVDKSHLICSHCRKKGHLKEQCFKLMGYPEWFAYNPYRKDAGKSFQTQHPMNLRANIVTEDVNQTDETNSLQSMMMNMMKQELAKLLKDKKFS